ncbi:MAG: PLP-dependent aminotransferase family protein [Chloroflexi bacterium]|nr:PLP-dependent aminotransferase family protein [Chloroflexota bacterium]
MSVSWNTKFADRTSRMQASDIRELLKLTARPEVISLAGGLPAPELFPVDEYRRAFEWVLETNGSAALQYGPTEGYAPLREVLAQRMTRLGIPAQAGDILITNGSQQGLDLVGKVFLNPGDAVCLENPSYMGAIQAFDSYQAEYVIVPMDDEGMRSEELDSILRRHPVKFIYALPNFQNPSGRTMSARRREILVETARHHGVPIVEDDPYGELRFEGASPPSLRSLWPEGIIYLGTFSKILAPGFRLGWIVAPRDLYDMLVFGKQPADLHTSSASQMATYEVCHKEGFLDAHIEKIRDVYRERRDVMLRALERYFPEGCRWTRAEGGLFVWAELPPSIDTRELLADALAENVAFVPGQSFHADRSGHNTMRLNFSNVPPDRIEEGIARLGRAIEKRLARTDAERHNQGVVVSP